MTMRKIAIIMMACVLLAGCSSVKAETAETATTTAETATTTAETAATTAETATPATAATVETTPIHYIVVYDDGTEVSLYVDGDEVYFFEGGGRTKKDNIPGLSNLPKVSGRVKRSEIGDADLLDYIKENAY